MITDATALADIARQWTSVQGLKNWSRSVVLPGLLYHETPPENFYNLPLVLAYSVLDIVLRQMIIEGVFPCAGNHPMLGNKMIASKNQITWIDYNLIDKGRNDRNDLAHEAKLVGKEDCLEYIKAIGDQLSAWQIIA